MNTENKFYTDDEARELIDDIGSGVGIKNPKTKITSVDFDNPITTWIFSPSTKNKIIQEEIKKSIDVNISELKPNIPTQTIRSVSLDEYNRLLLEVSSSLALANELKASNINLNSRISELISAADFAIIERIGKEQINDVLTNQLESLVSTITNIADQLSKTIQKSIEESVIRSSLQAQNEGYKAQINALLSQIDSLNAIIQGLYNQLGAVQVQQEINVEAESLAQQLNGYNINAVVMYPEIPKCVSWKSSTDTETICYPWYGACSNTSDPPNYFKWVAGGKMTFKNLNKVTCKVTAQVIYPYNNLPEGETRTTTVQQKFFTLSNSNFTIQPGQEIDISAIYNKDGIKQLKWSDGVKIQTDTFSKTTRYGYGSMRLEIENLIAGTKKVKLLPVGFVLFQGKDQFFAFNG